MSFASSYEPSLIAGGQIAIWLSVLLIVRFHDIGLAVDRGGGALCPLRDFWRSILSG